MNEAKKNFYLGQKVEVIIPKIRAVQVNFITLICCHFPITTGRIPSQWEMPCGLSPREFDRLKFPH
jgi:hypothetical protein